MGNLSEQPKIFKPKIEKSETQAYIEENLGDFENVEIKKLSELPCWKKISNFIASKKMSGIDNLETVIVTGGKQWEKVFGSNDSKSSHEPMTIILKKEIFDNENISDEDASWLVHEIGHIKFYQDLGDKLDVCMEDYHKRGEYTGSDMEKSAFGMQFEYLKSIGKTRGGCEDVIRKYLEKSFGEDEKESKANGYKQIVIFLDNVYEADTEIYQSAGNETQEVKKRKILEEKSLEIDKVADAEGRGIDEEIKNTIIALNIADFPTTASCQGHFGEESGGMGAPWIRIGAEDEPEERFNNQNVIFQRVAEKYGMLLEELRRSFDPDAYWEAMKEASQQGETAEFQEWDRKNQELYKKAEALLAEFYKDREVDESARLQLEDSVGGFIIHNGEDDYKDVEENVSEEEKNAHKRRLEIYREEMNKFAEFLIDKFTPSDN
jgi:hypothetical protein